MKGLNTLSYHTRSNRYSQTPQPTPIFPSFIIFSALQSPKLHNLLSITIHPLITSSPLFSSEGFCIMKELNTLFYHTRNNHYSQTHQPMPIFPSIIIFSALQSPKASQSSQHHNLSSITTSSASQFTSFTASSPLSSPEGFCIMKELNTLFYHTRNNRYSQTPQPTPFFPSFIIFPALQSPKLANLLSVTISPASQSPHHLNFPPTLPATSSSPNIFHFI